VRGSTLLAVAAAVLLFLSSASAQTTPPGGGTRTFTPGEQQQLNQAQELFDRGSELSKKKESQGKATRLVKQSLAIRERILGKEHAQTMMTANAVGQSLTAQGQYATAQPYFERVLKVYKRFLGDHPLTATLHGNLAFVLEEQEKLDQAQQNYEQALRILKEKRGREHVSTINVVNRLAVLHASQGEYDAAIPYQEWAVEVYSKAFGESAESAGSMMILGRLHKRARNYPEAVSQFQKALEIRKKILGEKDPATALSLHEIGVLQSIQQDYQAARRSLEEAVAIRKEVLGEEDFSTAMSLSDLGIVHSSLGDYEAARACHEEALAIRSKLFPQGHPFVADSHRNLGNVLGNQGDYPAARAHFEQALAMQKKTLGNEHPVLVATLTTFATLLVRQGHYATARPLNEQALAISQTAYGKEHPQTASALSGLGSTLSYLGENSAARRYHEQALAIRRKVLGEKHSDTAVSFYLLGNLYLRQGDYGPAFDYLQRAVNISKQVNGAQHPQTAKYTASLASFLGNVGKYREALPLHEEALAVRQKLLGEEHPTTVDSIHRLGITHTGLGNYDTAASYLEQALKLRRKIFGDEHHAVADLLIALARLSRLRGEFSTSQAYYEEALAIHRKIYGPQHPNTVFNLMNLASVHQAQGNWELAVQNADQARRQSLESTTRVLRSLDPRAQAKFLSTQQVQVYGALSLAYANRSEPQAVAGGAAWLINSKGLASEALAQRQLLERDSDHPQVQSSVEELQEVRRKLAAQVMSTPQPGQTAARSSAIFELTQQEQKLTREIAQIVGSSVETAKWIELEEVRGKIDSEDVLVSFARTGHRDFQATGQDPAWKEERYLAWLIPAADGGDVQVLDLGVASEIDDQLKHVRELVSNPGSSEQLTKAFQQLAEQVWQPIARKLPEGTSDLILSPDGALWLLPWSALPVGDDRFLIEDYSLRYVVSGRELVQSAGNISNARPLLFADPTFDLSPDQTRTAVEAIFRGETFNWDARRGMVSQTALGKVSPLPNTRLEAAAIAPSLETISEQEPVSYLGQYALETVVKRIKRPRMLVLSTHGFFLPDQQVASDQGAASSDDDSRSSDLLTVYGQPIENPLLRCGMLFAGCNQPAAGADDGVLTGMEIVGMDLRGTELVVLSACETGLGDVRNGEGVAGLRQAFRLAGAEGVVSTLWSVPDRDSAIIMKDFFTNLAEGQSKAEALRSAQLQRIESRRERYGTAHPFYWAAWTMTGR